MPGLALVSLVLPTVFCLSPEGIVTSLAPSKHFIGVERLDVFQEVLPHSKELAKPQIRILLLIP
jgi:hypothetical protein